MDARNVPVVPSQKPRNLSNPHFEWRNLPNHATVPTVPTVDVSRLPLTETYRPRRDPTSSTGWGQCKRRVLRYTGAEPPSGGASDGWKGTERKGTGQDCFVLWARAWNDGLRVFFVFKCKFKLYYNSNNKKPTHNRRPPPPPTPQKKKPNQQTNKTKHFL